MEQKKQLAAVDGQAIEEIQQKINQMDQAERDEKEKALQKDQPQKAPKRTFDLKSLMAKKQAEEEIESQKKVDDPYAVKLTSVPGHCTEQDITDMMGKFGKIESCYIPVQEGHGRSNKIAIVRYKFKEEATRAVEEGEVNIEFSVVTIERAIQR